MTGEELKQQIALYESADHTVHLDVKVDEDTVWVEQTAIGLAVWPRYQNNRQACRQCIKGRAQWIFSCRKICDNCI